MTASHAPLLRHHHVDTTHPRYIAGERAARILIDTGALTTIELTELLRRLELAQAALHAKDDDERYLRARAFGDTIRDYLEERH